MILQALAEHYERLVQDPESHVAPPGYSSAKVSHALVLSEQGGLVDIWKIADVKGKKSVPKILLVPEQVTRTSGIAANILCDGASYVLGIERTKKGYIKISQEKHADFKQKNLAFLADIAGKEAAAVRCFLEKWEPMHGLNHPLLSSQLDEILDGSNIVFKLDGTIGFVHEEDNIKAAWEKKALAKAGDVVSQCLVTGKELPIARIHPMIKGVVGAQTSGAAIVSFNINSFTSYGKSQSYNAPVSESAAFAYATALNYLIASDTNRVRIADSTVVFWADKQGGKAEELVLAWSLDPVNTEAEDYDKDKRRIDHAAALQAKTILERVKDGLPIGDASLDPDTRLFLLGLAPNAARLAVRFWQVSSFGDVLTKIAQHYKDMDIDGLNRIVSPWQTLKAIAIQEDAKNIPPLLGGQLLKSIISGHAYPQTVYNLALNRCRTGGEHGGVNAIRAAIIKACLLRKYRIQKYAEREAMITVSLNENNPNTGYQLGRLFSLLEKAQRDALGSQVNATIRDRYFGAASATPGAVFPLLLRLSRHHIAKAEYGGNIDRKIQEVMDKLNAFPAHLNLEDQGQFILGYYHQNRANYTKKDNKEEKEG